MSPILRVVQRVIQRRMDAGEPLDTILLDYPKLTESELAEILPPKS
ncbi:MAG: hypothetical protein RR528_05390 [Angelakisella sp.]